MSEIRLKLHPRQSLAILSKATEILYGGAAGGGKSHLTEKENLPRAQAREPFLVLFWHAKENLTLRNSALTFSPLPSAPDSRAEYAAAPYSPP